MMEVQEANSGRAGFPTFLKRSPLPRAVPAGGLPGQGRLGAEQCYSPSDLRIGATLTVLGRSLLIYDCDDATRRWYMVSGRRRQRRQGCPLAFLPARLPARLPACPDAAFYALKHSHPPHAAAAPAPLQEHQGFTPELLAPIDVEEPVQALPVAQLPPHTGIGSPEDSLQNCLKLVPKPAKKDPYRWAKLVRWRCRQWLLAWALGGCAAAGSAPSIW